MNVLTIMIDRTEKGLVLKNWSAISSDGRDLNAIEVLQSLNLTSSAILQLLNMVPVLAKPQGKSEGEGGKDCGTGQGLG